MEPEEESIILNLGIEGGAHTFQNWGELQNWIQLELNKWGWIRPDESGKAREMQGAFKNIRQQINLINDINATPLKIKPSKVAEFAKRLETLFGSQNLVYSSSQIGTYVLGLSNQNSVVAHAALDYLTGQSPTDYPDQAKVWGRIKSVAEAALFKSGVGGTEIYSEIFSRFLQANQNALTPLLNSFLEKERNLIGQIGTLKTERESEINAWKSLVSSTKTEREKENEDFKKRIAAIEKTYREAIQLKAPVDYWEAQKKSHNTAALIYSIAFSVVGIGYVFSFVGVAYLLTNHLKSLGYEKYGLLALFATVGGAGVRILYKLFINNIHGKTVAQEKVVQIKTFLALQAEGNKMGSVELNLLLNSILRPRSTSLLKDDYPIVSPIEIIQKAVRGGG